MKRIEIHAHSDASGSPKANKRLSERRARAVAAYLVNAGVEAGRLHTVAHGESSTQGRRIEFTITDRAALSAIAR
jgi:outer membrane protein OmpA-like peptidoglycan-associated protein